MAEKMTEARSMRDVLKWIVANEHHEGWWEGPPTEPVAFNLRGRNAHIRIPADVHVSGMIEADDFNTTARMYRPSPAGRSALASTGGTDAE